MSRFATLPKPEQRLLIEQAAARQGVVSIILEKDFWVCWMLGRVFATPKIAPHTIFKGGTSLSKVFNVIDRFSEDIDLSVAPSSLGFAEADLDDAPSASQRSKRMAKLGEQCATWVREHYLPMLEHAVTEVLGRAPNGGRWLRFELDAMADTPNLLFAYPSVLPLPGGYVAKQVKLEFGALTRQQPTGRYSIAPLLTDTLGTDYEDFLFPVTALELERTFWEKATILHAEHHRPADKQIRDRFARHYSDFAALWRHGGRAQALARMDLLEDVVRHKSRFFASSWANYGTARLGTFRLLPPAHRRAALTQDYAQMRPMFLTEPPAFDEVMAQLAEAEVKLNRS